MNTAEIMVTWRKPISNIFATFHPVS